VANSYSTTPEEDAKAIFEMIYQWGKAGSYVDHEDPTYRKMLRVMCKRSYNRGYMAGRNAHVAPMNSPYKRADIIKKREEWLKKEVEKRERNV
jgi:hypothetical protein